jgi:hypothetical protein
MRLAGWAVGRGMGRTKPAAIVEPAGILHAVTLTWIGSSSEALLVGVNRIDEYHDHEPQERSHDEQDLPQDTRHRFESSRHAPRYSTRVRRRVWRVLRIRCTRRARAANDVRCRRRGSRPEIQSRLWARLRDARCWRDRADPCAQAKTVGDRRDHRGRLRTQTPWWSARSMR